MKLSQLTLIEWMIWVLLAGLFCGSVLLCLESTFLGHVLFMGLTLLPLVFLLLRLMVVQHLDPSRKALFPRSSKKPTESEDP